VTSIVGQERRSIPSNGRRRRRATESTQVPRAPRAPTRQFDIAIYGLRVASARRLPQNVDANDPLNHTYCHLERYQRPSGCIDLPGANYDSPPDTAFAVAKPAPVARIARDSSDTTAADTGTVERTLEPFLRGAGDGVAAREFDAPSHR